MANGEKSLPALSTQEAAWVAEHVRAEQVQLIYRQALPRVFVSAIVAATVVLILWTHGDKAKLITWLVASIAMTLMRLGLVLWQRSSSNAGERFMVWERRFVVSVALTSVVWGVGGWWIMPSSVAYQAVVYFFLIGMCSGTAAIYSAHVVSVAVSIFLIIARPRSTSPCRTTCFIAVWRSAAFFTLRWPRARPSCSMSF